MLLASVNDSLHHLLGDIAWCIIAAMAMACIANVLRQPLLLGYIGAGILLGSEMGLGKVANAETIDIISEIGLILLLFMIGLEIDLHKLKKAGKPVALAGIGQFLICAAIGYGFFTLTGHKSSNGQFSGLYLAITCALSSTMIVVKLLYDKRELDTLPGRISLGILVFQDIWAILFLAIQANLSNPGFGILFSSFLKGIAVILFAFGASRFVLPALFMRIAKSPELMLIGSVAWCFLVSAIADMIGLSKEMGALIAGVAISTFPYNHDVIGKIVNLRDFFTVLFFVALGLKIPKPTLDVLMLAGGASLLIVLSRFLSITPLLHALKLGHRASLLPAINLSQISEFSLVIASLGLAQGHIDSTILATVVMTLVITATASSYMIQYNQTIAKSIGSFLSKAGIRDLGGTAEEASKHPHAPRIVFLGFYHVASSLLEEIRRKSPDSLSDILVVDFNPLVRKKLTAMGVHCIYGDLSHKDTLKHAHLEAAEYVLSTIPDSILVGTSNERLLMEVKKLAPKAQVIVTAESPENARKLYDAGADFVSLPRMNAAEELTSLVTEENIIPEKRQYSSEKLATREEVLS